MGQERYTQYGPGYYAITCVPATTMSVAVGSAQFVVDGPRDERPTYSIRCSTFRHSHTLCFLGSRTLLVGDTQVRSPRHCTLLHAPCVLYIELEKLPCEAVGRLQVNIFLAKGWHFVDYNSRDIQDEPPVLAIDHNPSHLTDVSS